MKVNVMGFLVQTLLHTLTVLT